MTVTAVGGAQWGDEGKGKFIDLIIPDYDIVVRWNGGDNSGHTVETDEFGKFVLHFIPSGIAYKNKINVISNGEVVNLRNLSKEIMELRSAGIDVNPDKLIISDRTHLILPYYMEIERKKEALRGIGTTGRGIGVAYQLKADRTGIRVIDLLEDEETFKRNVAIHGEEYQLKLDPEKIREEQLELLKENQQFLRVEDTLEFFKRNRDANFLLEGAQAALLDVDAGTYGFTTSSNPIVGGAYVGAYGIPPINKVILVGKGFDVTRVGHGPFPTELGTEKDIETVKKGEEKLTPENVKRARNGDVVSVAKYLRVRGVEYGTSTGRPRRCGWNDLVALEYVVNLSRIAPDVSLALTKIDVVDGLPQLKMCVGYMIKGKETTRFPSDIPSLYAAKPIYDTLGGWDEPTRGATELGQLNSNARKGLEYLEKKLGIPISMVSTGPNRKETIIL